MNRWRLLLLSVLTLLQSGSADRNFVDGKYSDRLSETRRVYSTSTELRVLNGDELRDANIVKSTTKRHFKNEFRWQSPSRHRDNKLELTDHRRAIETERYRDDARRDRYVLRQRTYDHRDAERVDTRTNRVARQNDNSDYHGESDIHSSFRDCDTRNVYEKRRIRQVGVFLKRNCNIDEECNENTAKILLRSRSLSTEERVTNEIQRNRNTREGNRLNSIPQTPLAAVRLNSNDNRRFAENTRNKRQDRSRSITTGKRLASEFIEIKHSREENREYSRRATSLPRDSLSELRINKRSTENIENTRHDRSRNLYTEERMTNEIRDTREGNNLNTIHQTPLATVKQNSNDNRRSTENTRDNRDRSRSLTTGERLTSEVKEIRNSREESRETMRRATSLPRHSSLKLCMNKRSRENTVNIRHDRSPNLSSEERINNKNQCTRNFRERKHLNTVRIATLGRQNSYDNRRSTENVRASRQDRSRSLSNDERLASEIIEIRNRREERHDYLRRSTSLPRHSSPELRMNKRSMENIEMTVNTRHDRSRNLYTEERMTNEIRDTREGNNFNTVRQTPLPTISRNSNDNRRSTEITIDNRQDRYRSLSNDKRPTFEVKEIRNSREESRETMRRATSLPRHSSLKLRMNKRSKENTANVRHDGLRNLYSEERISDYIQRTRNSKERNHMNTVRLTTFIRQHLNDNRQSTENSRDNRQDTFRSLSNGERLTKETRNSREERRETVRRVKYLISARQQSNTNKRSMENIEDIRHPENRLNTVSLTTLERQNSNDNRRSTENNRDIRQDKSRSSFTNKRLTGEIKEIRNIREERRVYPLTTVRQYSTVSRILRSMDNILNIRQERLENTKTTSPLLPHSMKKRSTGSSNYDRQIRYRNLSTNERLNAFEHIRYSRDERFQNMKRETPKKSTEKVEYIHQYRSRNLSTGKKAIRGIDDSENNRDERNLRRVNKRSMENTEDVRQDKSRILFSGDRIILEIERNSREKRLQNTRRVTPSRDIQRSLTRLNINEMSKENIRQDIIRRVSTSERVSNNIQNNREQRLINARRVRSSIRGNLMIREIRHSMHADRRSSEKIEHNRHVTSLIGEKLNDNRRFTYNTADIRKNNNINTVGRKTVRNEITRDDIRNRVINTRGVPLIGDEIRSRVNIFGNSGLDKVQIESSYVPKWQHLFYVLQGIYICNLFITMSKGHGELKNKRIAGWFTMMSI